MLANITDDSLRGELRDIQSRLPVVYRYIVARSLTTSDAAALRTLGYTYSWLASQGDRDYYNSLAERLACDRLLQAGLQLQELLPNAIAKLGELLDSDSERIRLQAATAILDRVGLERATASPRQPGTGGMRNLADVILNIYGGAAGGAAGDDSVGSGGPYARAPGAGQVVDGLVVDGQVVDGQADGDIARPAPGDSSLVAPGGDS